MLCEGVGLLGGCLGELRHVQCLGEFAQRCRIESHTFVHSVASGTLNSQIVKITVLHGCYA